MVVGAQHWHLGAASSNHCGSAMLLPYKNNTVLASSSLELEILAT